MRLAAGPASFALACVSLALLPACAPPAPAASAPPAEALACATEAEQLLEPVTVRAAPAAGSPALLELARGRFVYRCQRRGDWRAIMFPAPDEAVDCAQRPPPHACPTGWVRGEFKTAIFG